MEKTYSFRLSFLDGISKPIGGAKASVTGFNKSVGTSEKSIEALESSIKDLTRVMAVMGSQMNGEAMSRATKNTSNLNKGILTLTGSTLGLNRGLGRLAGSVGAAFAVGATIRAAVGGLVEMESAQARFSMLLGRNQEATKEAFQKIQTFAVQTPFSIADSTKAFEMLLRQGLNPTVNELAAMGDIAAFSGKSMEDFAGILERAQKLDFAALEELGVKAEESGDKVKLTFQGQTTTIAQSSEAIRQYVMAMANNSTVAGAMAVQNETTGAKVDKLKDSFTILTQTLGEALKPAIDVAIAGLTWISDAVSNLTLWVQDNWNWLGVWVEGIGRVTLALGAAWLGMKVFNGAGAIIKNAILGFTGLTKGINLAKMATAAFNMVAKISPFGWIGIVVGAVISLWDYLSDFTGWMSENFGPAIEAITLPLRLLWWTIKKIGEGVVWVMDTMNPAAALARKVQTTSGLREHLGEEKFQEAMKNEGFRKHFEKMKAKEDAANQEDMPADTSLMPPGETPSGTTPSGFTPPNTTPPTKTVSQGLADIQENSGAAKNITINIQKLVEQLVIQTTNIVEAPAKIKEEITKALLGAVNDVNAM